MQSIEVHWSGRFPQVDRGLRSKASNRPFQYGRSVFWSAPSLVLVLALLVPSSSPPVLGATRSPKQQVVPNWARFERVLVSTFEYTNALQEATLTAVFTSPFGERRTVNGFWDGGRTWRVRFCPDVPGQWTFTTFCSDPGNAGLDGQTGKFLCTAPVGDDPFRRHGPIRVARDHTHFEHADGTPFFWLADTTGPGAMLSDSKDWQRYASIRSSQLFNVTLWSIAPGENVERESPLTGFRDRIGVNPKFFQQLDAKLDALSREGILSAIVPLPDAASVKAVPEDQAVLLIQYLQARWGTEPVAWVFNLDTEEPQTQPGRWRKIGGAVFTNSVHSPVLVCGSASEDFAEQNPSWVDAIGVKALDNAPGQALGSPSNPLPRGRSLPVVLFSPRENGVSGSARKRFNPDDVRHAIYQNLFLEPPAGVTYAAQGVATWDTTAELQPNGSVENRFPMWEKALFLPGAKQMRSLANLMNSIDFWRLRPRPDAVPNQSTPPAARIMAASTAAKDLTLVYLPQSAPVDVALQAMPPSPLISWLEPRQGSTRSAVAVVSGSVCQFPPPGEGDWVLLIKSSK